MQVKSLALQLLSVLDFLHSRTPPVVHRDLKCANLLLTDEGRLKLGDFGLSRVLAAPGEAMTNRVITLWYRPPELLLGAEEYSPAVDLWSVGALRGTAASEEERRRGSSPHCRRGGWHARVASELRPAALACTAA